MSRTRLSVLFFILSSSVCVQAQKPELVVPIGHTGSVNSVAFSSNGQYILSGSWDHTLKLWEVSTGKLLRSLRGHTDWVTSVAFSPNGHYGLSGSRDNTIILWKISTGEVLRNWEAHDGAVKSVAFSPDGRYVLSGSNDHTLKLWEVSTGKLLRSFEGHTDRVESVAFSPNSRYGLSGSRDSTLKFWEISTGHLLRSFEGHTDEVASVAFSPDGRYGLSGSGDNTTKIWNIASGKELATLIAVDSTDWIVTTPAGLFDASPGAMKLMHYVVNDSMDHDEPWKVIDLEQLKHRYYQPGLLPILMGFSKEPLRQVPAFEEVALPPSIQLSLLDQQLTVQLKNRKGGIGKVLVSINGAEVVEDLRANPQQDSTQTMLTLTLPLAQFASRFDTANVIRMAAFNGAGWLSSRPQEITFRPDANRRGVKPDGGQQASKRDTVRLQAVVVGTSNVGLRFAHKDAQQIANGLRLAASELLGTDRVNVQTLISEDKGLQQTSKADIVKALLAGQQTRPQDMFVLYLSGHGVNFGGQDGDFYYLTAGATSADASYLNDPAIRQTYALSSEELTRYLNLIPARKKLLILDVCAAGRGAEKLLAARDIPASQIRALDRLQSRTGFYVLADSAADAVSYESNVYGQGLLTYALLKGMRGASLRREGSDEYVDVEKWLGYAVEQVPLLAKEIRGIQQPFYRGVGSQADQRSFDVGRVTDKVKQQIHIAEPKPVLIVKSFQEETQLDDVLELKNKVESALIDLNARGSDAPMLYMEAKDYPGAYRLSGRYSLQGEAISVFCKVFRASVSVGDFTIKGQKNKLSDLASQILAQARGVIK